MKTVILCRHAKSDWPESIADIRRPLKQRGIKDANFLGDLLRSQAFRPDLIMTSPAQRAKQTAEIVSTCISYPGELREEPDIYYEGETKLISLIRTLPIGVDTVMVFGHNPTLENLVQRLLGSQAMFDMPTCGMACFETYEAHWRDWGQHHLPLRWLLVPRFKRKEKG
jgi:phosphohistidine phosphatase